MASDVRYEKFVPLSFFASRIAKDEQENAKREGREPEEIEVNSSNLFFYVKQLRKYIDETTMLKDKGNLFYTIIPYNAPHKAKGVYFVYTTNELNSKTLCAYADRYFIKHPLQEDSSLKKENVEEYNFCSIDEEVHNDFSGEKIYGIVLDQRQSDKIRKYCSNLYFNIGNNSVLYFEAPIENRLKLMEFNVIFNDAVKDSKIIKEFQKSQKA